VVDAVEDQVIHEDILTKMSTEDIPVPPLPSGTAGFYALSPGESPPGHSFRLTVDQLRRLGVPRQPDRIARRLMQLSGVGPSADRIKSRLGRKILAGSNPRRGKRLRKRGSKS
jgi:hypothetical protein